MKIFEEIGRYFIFLQSLLVNRESFMTYFRLTMEECVKVGINSALLVILVSAFLGAVSTIQTAYNLVSPLIPDYIISLVVRDMAILELSPTIIAVIFAGKVGSSMASGLGTMRISEQIDALEVMGINSASYLVLPKIVAAMLMYPMLVIISMIVIIVGGYIAGDLSGVITPTEYIFGIRFEFNPFTVTFALIKAFVFAFLISSISSFKGYFTKGGALEVGQTSTQAVTQSVILVLVADYLLAFLLL
ncbi:MAG: MlaE family ABC transporter permease [Candidatus Cyclobacteriaceae bacterium M2_1C_046]